MREIADGIASAGKRLVQPDAQAHPNRACHEPARHSAFPTGRSMISYLGTWVLSSHDSRAAPQTVHRVTRMHTKNFSSVRRY